MLGFCVQAPARRTSQSIRQEKERTHRQITETHRKISANQSKTERELAQLQSIRANMELRRDKIDELVRQKKSLAERVSKLEDTISYLDGRVASLRDSYATSLRAMRRQRQVAGRTSAIFSSSSFSQAKRRIRYLEQLLRWKKQKEKELRVSIDEVNQRKSQLEKLKENLERKENELQMQVGELEEKQISAETLVISLKKQKKDLQQVLLRQQAQADQLERELQRIIEEEASKTKPKHEQAIPHLGGNFAQNKGKLPIPVDAPATVISEFGRRTHEDFEKVTVQNNGIDFEAPVGSKAVAVFPGTVSMVIVMQGYQNVVLVRHGEYLTVYAGLSDISVRKGDEVKTGTPLGTLQSSPGDPTMGRLHFEVRKEKEKLNPSDWLNL